MSSSRMFHPPHGDPVPVTHAPPAPAPPSALCVCQSHDSRSLCAWGPCAWCCGQGLLWGGRTPHSRPWTWGAPRAKGRWAWLTVALQGVWATRTVRCLLPAPAGLLGNQAGLCHRPREPVLQQPLVHEGGVPLSLCAAVLLVSLCSTPRGRGPPKAALGEQSALKPEKRTPEIWLKLVKANEPSRQMIPVCARPFNLVRASG